MSLNALQRRLELADLEYAMTLENPQQFAEYLESLTEENIHEKAYRFDYIRNVFEKEFRPFFLALEKEDKLVYELIRLTSFCEQVFVHYDYPLKEGCELLYSGIKDRTAGYLRQQHQSKDK